MIDAVHRNLEIIGEAAKHIGPETGAGHADIPRIRVAALRSLLAHASFDTDNGIIWDIVEHYVPELLAAMHRALGSGGEANG